MIIEMHMPQMGESVAEATVTKWLKQVGERVAKDEALLEITTDKVDSEIPSPSDGILKEIKANEGDTVEVKAVIALIETEAAGEVVLKEAVSAASTPTQAVTKASPATPKETHALYSPLVRNLADKHGINMSELSKISGSGPGSRITKHDLLEYLVQKGTGPTQLPPIPQAIVGEFDKNGLRVEPMNKMRSLIADHMVRSKQTSPHVYTVAEVDMSKIVSWRRKHIKELTSRFGFKLNYTPFFLEATAHALAAFPQINASLDNSNIIYKRDVHLGCAVALGTEGLIVPVIRKADQLSFSGLAQALQGLADKARSKSLSPDDTTGGTFTVTNAGTFGSILSYPIINQPQLGILGIGAIKKRPVVINDLIGIRDICFITLSYDHRLIDGSLAGRFLQQISNHLEHWDEDRAV